MPPALLRRLSGHEIEEEPSIKDEVKSTLANAETKPEPDPVSWGDSIAYRAENLISSSPNSYYYGLVILTSVLVVVLGLAWELTKKDTDTGGNNPSNPFFFALQVIVSGGNDGSVTDVGPMIVYMLLLVAGLVVFAILIGMITEEFQNFVQGIAEGRSKVTASGHTLILGWNETTVRVVCQCALLRRGWRMQNETCVRRCCPCRRVPATSPVAEAPIIIMNNSISKAEMQDAIEAAFAERGISRRRTKIGVDVVCRVGDPTVPQDLQRVGAHRATSILIQMNEADRQEEEQHGGAVSNGMTFRTLMSLRVVLFSEWASPDWEELRVVCQLTSPTKAIDVISLGAAGGGRPILSVQDLSIFLNSLMFNCTAQPGLAFALLDLLGFEGTALRLREVKKFQDGGKHLIGKTFKEISNVFEDGVPAGIISGSSNWEQDLPKEIGLAPVGDRLIKEDDRVIFISEHSMPGLAIRDAEKLPSVTENASVEEPPPVKVLVCGWRPEWDDPERFAFRIRDAAEELPNDSEMCFLCTKGMGAEDTEGAFREFMEGVCKADDDIASGERDDDNLWTFQEHVVIRYRPGDAADYDVLNEAVSATTFQQAIILSTMANENLAPFSKDTRVMSIMLFLRHLQKEKQQAPMHIIGENSMDSTAYLAMGPVATQTKVGSRQATAPDFVNVHAIYARALVQCLAYPRMNPAISQLFSGRPGMPSIRLESVGGRVPKGKHTFGALVAMLKSLPDRADDVLVGVRLGNGCMVMSPSLSDVMEELGEDCKFILMTRRLTKSQSRSLERAASRKSFGSGLQAKKGLRMFAAAGEPPQVSMAQPPQPPQSPQPPRPPAAAVPGQVDDDEDDARRSLIIVQE